MHITSSVFINDDERGPHADYEDWLEELAPHEPISRYRHGGTSHFLRPSPASMGAALSPHLVVRGDVFILGAATRLGHHLSDGVAPDLVVDRLLMLRRVCGRSINFDQHRIYVPSRLFWPPKPFYWSFESCATVPNLILNCRGSDGVPAADARVFYQSG